MSRDLGTRTLGLLMVFASVFVLGVLFQDYRFDRTLTAERSAMLATEREIGWLEVALSDLRAAQASYVAAGQGSEFWMRRADELSTGIASGLARLLESSESAAAQEHYQAAATALEDLGAVDRRVRTHVNANQRLLAGDLIFIDSQEASQRLSGELSAARLAESATLEADRLRTSSLRYAMNTAAMSVLLLFALYVSRAIRRPPISEAAQTAQMLRDLPPPVRPPSTTPRPGTVTPVVSLADAADLCVDLARVLDGRDISSLLERAASVLDARGVIVWTADPTGTRLHPSLTCGYSDRVLARMSALGTDADNVTSLAFRSMQPQMLPGVVSGAAGAVAVPLMTASGCVGVLSTETREPRPASETVAVTKIIAAQFAALIGPADQDAARVAEA